MRKGLSPYHTIPQIMVELLHTGSAIFFYLYPRVVPQTSRTPLINLAHKCSERLRPHYNRQHTHQRRPISCFLHSILGNTLHSLQQPKGVGSPLPQSPQQNGIPTLL